MHIDFLLFSEAMENNGKYNRDEDNEKSITAKITSRSTLVLITLNAFVGVALLLGSATSNPMVYVFGEEDDDSKDDDGAGDEGGSSDLAPNENSNSPSKDEDEDEDGDGGHGSGNTPDFEDGGDTPDLPPNDNNSPSKDEDDNSGKGDEGGDEDDTEDLAPLDNTNSEGSSESGFDSVAGSDPDRTFIHYTEKIAIELSNLTPFEIKEYPITELSDEDLKLVLECLTTDNLTKVLLNIPKEDLAEIQDMLNAVTFDDIQKTLSEELM